MVSIKSTTGDWYSAAMIIGGVVAVGLGIVAYAIGGVFGVTEDYGTFLKLPLPASISFFRLLRYFSSVFSFPRLLSGCCLGWFAKLLRGSFY